MPERAKWLGIAKAAGVVSAARGGDAVGPDCEGVLGELRLPATYNESQPAPLLLAFHGSLDSGAGYEAHSGLTFAADQASFITVYPDGIDGTWDVNDVLLVVNLITHLSDKFPNDRDRSYVTGFSAGGTMTQLIAYAGNSEVMLDGIEGGGHLARRSRTFPTRPGQPGDFQRRDRRVPWQLLAAAIDAPSDNRKPRDERGFLYSRTFSH